MAVAIPAAEVCVAYYGDFQANEKVSIQVPGTLQSMAALTTDIIHHCVFVPYPSASTNGVQDVRFQHHCRAHAHFIFSDSTENLITTLVVYFINRRIFAAYVTRAVG